MDGRIKSGHDGVGWAIHLCGTTRRKVDAPIKSGQGGIGGVRCLKTKSPDRLIRVFCVCGVGAPHPKNP